jgi:type I restriction enzyme S subunit
MNICGVTNYAPHVTLPYIYSFLRSDFFVEQVWSLLNRGVYPRMDKGALDKIALPIPSDSSVIRYVSVLVQAIVEKEKAIKARHQGILLMVGRELLENQNGKVFRYMYPTNTEVQASSRMDTGLYCHGFREFKHHIDNYRLGSTCLSEMGIKSRRGPNLAVSVIGKSLYAEEFKQGWYQLIRPVNIGEYGTLTKLEWLGTPKKLPISNTGDLILGCEGFEKGRSIVLLEDMERCTTNFHGTTLYSTTPDITKIVFVRCFLAYLREHGVIDWVGVGGSGGHMSPEYFDYLPFPKFPDHKQAEIARLYHNPAPSPTDKPTLKTFVDWHRRWNENLGIWELDREMKNLQRTLADVQERIIEGKTVEIPLQ